MRVDTDFEGIFYVFMRYKFDSCHVDMATILFFRSNSKTNHEYVANIFDRFILIPS